MYEEVEKYKNSIERRVNACVRTIELIKPDNVMSWIQQNAPLDIKQYVCCAMLGKEYNVLMRSEKKWKTVVDLGLEIEEQGSRKTEFNRERFFTVLEELLKTCRNIWRQELLHLELSIAKKIAELRHTTAEHILRISYENAERIYAR